MSGPSQPSQNSTPGPSSATQPSTSILNSPDFMRLMSVWAQSATSVPLNMLGNINPAPQRVYTVDEGTLTTGATPSAPSIHSFAAPSTTVYKSITRGWSVHSVANFTVSLIPACVNTKGRRVEIHTAWIPNGEPLPTSIDEMSAFPSYDFTVSMPLVQAGSLPGHVFEAPINSFDLVANVKPKPLAGGYPHFVILTQMFGDPAPSANLDLWKVKLTFTLRIGV